MLRHESVWWTQGVRVAGVDEAGRGPLAGPVVAAAVVLPPGSGKLRRLDGLTDSKQLSPAKRQVYFQLIQEVALDWSLGVVSAGLIDRINILEATFLAMRRAIAGLEGCEHVLVDGNHRIRSLALAQTALIGGDGRSLSIAAASVLAKETRDAIMRAMDRHYPGYGFHRHKGYGTPMHRAAIARLGLSVEHRRSFCRNLPD